MTRATTTKKMLQDRENAREGDGDGDMGMGMGRDDDGRDIMFVCVNPPLELLFWLNVHLNTKHRKDPKHQCLAMLSAVAEL
mmetsp:Transcript_53146/g.129050  ORF Transcript_53146/g.129050 Transcript_53146/m.129050 type:complete len:81 (-) Transcript_53146:10-252(-)